MLSKGSTKSSSTSDLAVGVEGTSRPDVLHRRPNNLFDFMKGVHAPLVTESSNVQKLRSYFDSSEKLARQKLQEQEKGAVYRMNATAGRGDVKARRPMSMVDLVALDLRDRNQRPDLSATRYSSESSDPPMTFNKQHDVNRKVPLALVREPPAVQSTTHRTASEQDDQADDSSVAGTDDPKLPSTSAEGLNRFATLEDRYLLTPGDMKSTTTATSSSSTLNSSTGTIQPDTMQHAELPEGHGDPELADGFTKGLAVTSDKESELSSDNDDEEVHDFVHASALHDSPSETTTTTDEEIFSAQGYRNNWILELPKSYSVRQSIYGDFDVVLPPPPHRPALRKRNGELDRTRRVKIDEAGQVSYETYGCEEYDRGNSDIDPVTASTEWELEKRVEKMDIFSVDLVKDERGLGLSIIGLGFGTESGVEKLGIFVKNLTPGGAAGKDGRIQVNDQILEVDGIGLVGVSQTFAAQTLKNTRGIVRFLMGRDKKRPAAGAPPVESAEDPLKTAEMLERKYKQQIEHLMEELTKVENRAMLHEHRSRELEEKLEAKMESQRRRGIRRSEALKLALVPDPSISSDDQLDQSNDNSPTSSDTETSSELEMIKQMRRKLVAFQRQNTALELELATNSANFDNVKYELSRAKTERDEMSKHLSEVKRHLGEFEQLNETGLSPAEAYSEAISCIRQYEDAVEQMNDEYMILKAQLLQLQAVSSSYEKESKESAELIEQYKQKVREMTTREQQSRLFHEEKLREWEVITNKFKSRISELEDRLAVVSSNRRYFPEVDTGMDHRLALALDTDGDAQDQDVDHALVDTVQSMALSETGDSLVMRDSTQGSLDLSNLPDSSHDVEHNRKDSASSTSSRSTGDLNPVPKPPRVRTETGTSERGVLVSAGPPSLDEAKAILSRQGVIEPTSSKGDSFISDHQGVHEDASVESWKEERDGLGEAQHGFVKQPLGSLQPTTADVSAEFDLSLIQVQKPLDNSILRSRLDVRNPRKTPSSPAVHSNSEMELKAEHPATSMKKVNESEGRALDNPDEVQFSKVMMELPPQVKQMEKANSVANLAWGVKRRGQSKEASYSPQISKPVEQWDTKMVEMWLINLDMDRYSETFLRRGVDGIALLKMGSKQLKEIGVASSDRSELSKRLKELRTQFTARNPKSDLLKDRPRTDRRYLFWGTFSTKP